MKKTISHLIIAAPLAVAAFTMTSGATMAAEPTDIIVQAPNDDDPQPNPSDNDLDDLTNPEPCPTHGVDCSPNDDKDGPGNGGDDSSDNDGDDGDGGDDSDDDDEVGSIAVPTRIDAGLAPQEQGGMDLSWVIAGSALVTATGAAFAARRGPRSRA